MKITLEKFSGMIPRRNARLLPDTGSEKAENTKLWSGKLKPWFGNLAVCDPFQTVPRSIYLFGKNAIPPGFWFQFSESEVDVIKGQVGGDETERTYFTGGPQGRPQVTDKFIGIRGEEEEWSADEHYTIGNIIVGTATSGVYFECTTPGTAGSSEPSWDTTPPNTTADGTAVWTARALVASTLCSQLPDQSVNLGVPAPVDAPSAARTTIGGSIGSFEDDAGDPAVQNTGDDRSANFTVTGDGSSQTFSVSISLKIILGGNEFRTGGPLSVDFRLYRDTASPNKLVDSENVVEASWDQFVEPFPAFNEPGILQHNVTLSETFSLPAGPHTYSFSIQMNNFQPDISFRSSTFTWRSSYGTIASAATKIIIDLGANLGDNPFEVGSEILIEGVVGAANSNFEEINGQHEIIEIGGNSVTIALPNISAADYSSGGTWKFIPNDQAAFERFYVYTYIARMGALLQEGPPSPVSTVLGLLNESEVDLLGLSVPPAGFNISRIRIYRTVLGEDTADFKFVAEIGASNTTYTDTLLEGSTNIGEILQSEDWGPPPIDLHSIVQMPNGIMVGLSKNEVFLSQPFQPHAWPDKFRRSMNFNGVSTGVFGNTVLITTDGVPYLLTGNDPESMSMDKLELAHSCSSKRSTVDMGYSVVYASPDGVAMVGPGIARLVSESLFTKDEWSELNPPSIIAARWDDRYVGFYTKTNGDRGGFVFDPKNAEASYTELATIGEAAYTDPDDADLYLVDAANNIVKFDSDDAINLDFTWRSKRFHLPKPVNFGAAMVHAKSYPVGFSLFSIESELADTNEDEAVERYTGVITDKKPFRLPAGFTSDEYQIELRGDTIIEAAYVAETLRELNLV